MKKNKKNGKQSIQYFCKNCGVKINFHNALYRRALCVKCSRLGQKRPMQSENIKGVNNSNYKDGRTLKKHYCYRCNIEIQYATKFFGGGLCKRCSRIGKCNPNWKNGISKIPYSFDFYQSF